MGADFIDTVKKSFKKKWDRSLTRFKQGDLFDRHPQQAPRRFIAQMSSPNRLNEGDEVLLRRTENDVCVFQGNSEVARIKKPSPELIRSLTRSSGMAAGTVREVHRISKTVEVSTC